MKTLKFMFGDASNGLFSWRKFGTASVFIVFAYACIGYLHANNFGELPMSYIGVIGGVFAFYFAKNTVDGLRITSKNKENASTEGASAMG